MKTILKYIITFLTTILLMLFMLTLVSFIPRTAIQKNSAESAELLFRNNVHFYNLVGKAEGGNPQRAGDYSKVDQIADIMLLEIAYYIDEELPMETALWAGYYDGRKSITMNESYVRAVNEQIPANSQYLRYRHGSLVFVRPLLTICNIVQIKILVGFLIMVLLASLIIRLIKLGCKAEAVSVLISMSAVSVWFVALSLEYVWMFILTLAVALIAVKLAVNGKTSSLYKLFFLTGMLAAYFDFFTTESMTLLVPLLLVIRLTDRRNNEAGNTTARNADMWVFSVKSGLLWGVGYAGCWSMKWLITSIILRINAVQYINHNMLTHLGTFDKISAAAQIRGLLIRNFRPLFPLGYGVAGSVFFVLFVLFGVFLPVYRNAVVLKKTINWNSVLLYFLLGMLVYLRLIILRHHSYYHFFFTYRAQAASILALCFIILEMIGFKRN